MEVQKGVVIGKNCKISSHSFICEGVTIGENCFIGHGVVFINDNFPRAVNEQGELEDEKEWRQRFVRISIGNDVAIGSNATILGGIAIGAGAMIGAGSVVIQDVPPGEIWVGNPARFIRFLEQNKL